MTPLGLFAVRAEPSEIAAFRAAIGLPPGDRVPATFSMRWLAAHDVRDALRALASEPDLVPVHESQTFDHLGSLQAGKPYAMSLEGRRDTSPDRLVLAGVIADTEGTPLVRVETILRLFSTAAP